MTFHSPHPQGQCRVLGKKGWKGKLTAPSCRTVLSALINRGVIHIVVECGRELHKLSWNIVQSGCEPTFPNAGASVFLTLLWKYRPMHRVGQEDAMRKCMK